MASFSTIMLSIYPVYSDKIFLKEKRIEFRKRTIPDGIKKVLVYSTSPIKEVVGYFEVDRVVYNNPYSLWDEYSELGCMEKEKYFSYFCNKQIGYGILIGNAFRYSNPVKIDILNYKAPQFFRYVSESEFEAICLLGTNRNASRREVSK